MGAAPFSVAFVVEHPFGVLAGVHLPAEKARAPEAVLARLTPAERALADGEEGFRHVELVGGRLAWHAAAAASGLDGTLGRAEGRAPVPPAGVMVSLTHKRDLACALVGPAAAGRLGLDLEGEGRDRSAIAERVLRPAELAALAAAPAERRWAEVMTRFAVKEAIYKCLEPELGRYIKFSEAEVQVDLSSVQPTSGEFGVGAVSVHPQVTLHLERQEPVEALDCVCLHVRDRVLAAVRWRRGGFQP